MRSSDWSSDVCSSDLACVFDPTNHYVLGPHLCAAAEESPLVPDDLVLFGPTAPAAVDALTEAGLLRRRGQRWYWPDPRRASDRAEIPSTGGSPVQPVGGSTGRVVGTAHAGAPRGPATPRPHNVPLGQPRVVTDFDATGPWHEIAK